MIWNLVKSPVLWGLLAVAALVLAGLRIDKLQTSLKYEQEKATTAADTAKKDIATRDVAIDSLTFALKAQNEMGGGLLKRLDDIGQSSAAKESIIRKLTRENAELKMWSSLPIPPAAVQLLKRPAVTGSGVHKNPFPVGDAMPAAGGKP